jgi:hypothetical protein
MAIGPDILQSTSAKWRRARWNQRKQRIASSPAHREALDVIAPRRDLAEDRDHAHVLDGAGQRIQPEQEAHGLGHLRDRIEDRREEEQRRS